MELAFAVIGSMGMFHFKQKMSKKMMGGGAQGFANMANMGNAFSKFNQNKTQTKFDDSSDDEDIPP